MRTFRLLLFLLFFQICFTNCKTDEDNQRDTIETDSTDNPSKFVGVWMYWYSDVTTNHDGFSPRWISIYENGKVFMDMPIGGYVHYDENANKLNDAWGSYTVDGKQCVIKKDNVAATWKLELVDNSKISIDNGTYYAFRLNKDNQFLEGAWTTSSDQSKQFIESFEQGKRPIIYFTKDGNFRDYGQFFDRIEFSREDVNLSAGEGTYEIKNCTLILKYKDNRPSVEFAFSGSFDQKDSGKQTDNMIFIDRVTLYKCNW